MVFRVKMQKSFHYNAKLNFQMLLSNSLWKLKNLGNYQMMKILKTKIMAIFIDTGERQSWKRRARRGLVLREDALLIAGQAVLVIVEYQGCLSVTIERIEQSYETMTV